MDKPPPYSPPGVDPPQAGFISQSTPPPLPGPFSSSTNIHYQHPPVLDNTVIITTTSAMITRLGPHPQLITCPHCHHTTSSRVAVEASTKTHFFALLMCLFVCWPCCFLPYCIDSCQSKKHYCINCGAYVGIYEE